jgi:beta-glucosidase
MTATTTAPYQDASAAPEARAADLVSRMTLEEKVAVMAGAAAFSLHGVPRLGVPSLRMTDGPTGVRSNAGEIATVFPVGVAVAATWNPDLAREVAAAIAREAKALDEHVVLAPTINIVRTPIWGRNFETYSEDPHLAAELAIGYVDGLQGEGVGASLKHYAVNNQEHKRLVVSAEVDERTLREIYTAAFETVVKASNPWTVMASYNKVDGTYASENPMLLNDILKGEWSYDGVVVSDWGAVHSTAPAANAGLDLEMPGPAVWFGDKLLVAVKAGEVAEAVIDDHARRLALLMVRVGLLDGEPAQGGELRTPKHRAIAHRAAEEAIVLTRNEGGLLPLSRGSIRSLAVIGPNAAVARLQGGGSSRVNPGRRTTPLDALRDLLSEPVDAPGGSDGDCGVNIWSNRDGVVEVLYAEGVDSEPVPPTAQGRMFSPGDPRDAAGLLTELFTSTDCSGEPFSSKVERHISKWVSVMTTAPRQPLGSVRWSGYFWPVKDGRHEFSVRGDGDVLLKIDGAPLITTDTPSSDDRYDLGGSFALRRTAAIDLVAGRGYPITIEYVWVPARGDSHFETFSLGVRQPSGTMEEAVELARGADAAIVVVGSASNTEAEGYDREDIELPGAQNALVEAVLAANPRTIVVVNAGSPMNLPWADKVPAILISWLTGEEGPDALAGLIFGEAAPSGRLPVTFPRRNEDNPSFPYYPGGDSADYGEGLYVGYRHFDRANVAPLYPFGFGLTYTDFDYESLSAPASAKAGSTIEAVVTLKNVGARAGKEVVQLYVAPRSPRVDRPAKELKAFAKVELAPGETRRVTLSLPAAAFAYWAPGQGWRVDAGDYDLLVGASAGDVRLRAKVRLE